MSVIMDFSLDNPLIREYFEGSDRYAPVAELLYVHSHPLVTPNFVSQIERQINDTAEFMAKKNMKSAVNRFITLAENLGKQLPLNSGTDASEALKTLREIYQYCNKITGK